MIVIITGGSGLVGRALTRSLTQDGHEVIILSRAPEKVSGLPQAARAVQWDARTAAGWGDLLDETDAIVNLAGASLKGEGFIPSRWSKSRKALIRQSRLDAGAAVLQALRAASKKPAVLIQSSAIGYYGPSGPEPLTEDAPPSDDFLARLCVAWEKSTAEAQEMGVRQVVIRTGIPLTMEGGAFPLLVLPFKLFVGNTFGDGRQYYAWIHFADYIAALRFLLERPDASGVYNLTSPNPVTNREFAATLGRVLKRPSFFPIPAFVLKLALGEVSTVVLDGQRVIPQHLQSEGFEFRYPELQPALRALLGR